MRTVQQLAIVIIFLFISGFGFAEAEPASDPPLILTDGTAEVTGLNDSARISIAVVSNGRSLDQVGLENTSRTRSVLEGIRKLGIEELKVKTYNYRVVPQKDYKMRPPRIKGYEVQHTIIAELEELETEKLSGHVSTIAGRALEDGANSIHSIQFYIKNRQPLEKEALTRATKNAMERAETMARASGVRLKRIVSLSSYPVHTPRGERLLKAGVMQEDSAAPPVEAGESRINVRVNIAYEIE